MLVVDKKANKSEVNRALDSKVHRIRSLTSCRVLLKKELSTWQLIIAKGRTELRKRPDLFLLYRNSISSNYMPLQGTWWLRRKDSRISV